MAKPLIVAAMKTSMTTTMTYSRKALTIAIANETRPHLVRSRLFAFSVWLIYFLPLCLFCCVCWFRSTRLGQGPRRPQGAVNARQTAQVRSEKVERDWFVSVDARVHSTRWHTYSGVARRSRCRLAAGSTAPTTATTSKVLFLFYNSLNSCLPPKHSPTHSLIQDGVFSL